jgi:hypothetical protein
MKHLSKTLGALAAAIALFLAACGGSGGDSTAASSSTTGAAASASTTMVSTSSGAISAFGSVFVNGHEFDTSFVKVIDDDTLASVGNTSGLEVGMAVDVRSAVSGSQSVADEVHVDPLVRGVVDASDSGAGTLTVLGQLVQLTAATNFSDHRACASAAASPCAAVTGQSGLSATTGSGSAAVAGTFVTVHGYLFSTSASSGQANIVATLVSISDTPTSTTGANYKVEGLVTAVGSSTVTIGSLDVGLASATCYVSGMAASCASAFSVGQIVSAFTPTAPALPATALTAVFARQRSALVVQTAGANVELEGKVSSATQSPASFVIRGVTVDASALTTAAPAVGDVVRVTGTVASGGTSVTASAVKILQTAATATFGFEGNVDSVGAGTTAGTYLLSVLGQSISVDATTLLADRSSQMGHMGMGGSSSSAPNPFNITTFQTYLAASTSQHVLVRTQADSSGNLHALSVTIAPASTVASVSGVVDASPAPVNSAAVGTPTTFAVHGLSVSAAASSIVKSGQGHKGSTSAVVSAGDLVLARGAFAAGTLSVATPTLATATTDIVIDSGAPRGTDHDCF